VVVLKVGIEVCQLLLPQFLIFRARISLLFSRQARRREKNRITKKQVIEDAGILIKRVPKMSR
jgi:hypothetical protein